MARVVTGSNPDKITYSQAKEATDYLAVLNVPVSNLSEEIFEGGQSTFIPVTDPTWGDDGNAGIYYASVFGKFQDVAAIRAIYLGAGTLLQKLIKVASVSFASNSQDATESAAFSAIDNLQEVADSINAELLAGAPAAFIAATKPPANPDPAPVINGPKAKALKSR